MVKIFYRGIELASGISATPYVTRSHEMIANGERWGQKEVLELNGVLTGRCIGFSDYVALQNTLKNRLAQDFGTFSIEENGQQIFARSQIVIKQIAFSDSEYKGLIPYRIQLESYPQEYFSGHHGVLEPQNEYSFEEQDNGLVQLTHKISAKGFNTDPNNNNALNNARNFCYLFTGDTNSVTPAFITGMSGANYCLRNVEENVNRFNGTYSIAETYLVDRDNQTPGILRYTKDVQSGINEGLVTVSINGSVEGCKGSDITGLRYRYNNFNLYQAAQSGYNVITHLTDLNTGALSSGISEDPSIPRLNFNVAFDNNPAAAIWMDYKTDLNTDVLTDVSTYSFNATFQGRGNLKSRFEQVSGLYASTNLFILMGSGYSGYNLGVPWNPSTISSGLTIDQFNGQIMVESQFTNDVVPPSGLSKWDYNVSITPTINKYSSIMLTGTDTNLNDNGWVVYDLKTLTRANISIRGNAEIDSSLSVNSGIAIIRKQINDIKDLYITGNVKLRDSYNFSTGNKGSSRTVSFAVNYSMEDEPYSLIPGIADLGIENNIPLFYNFNYNSGNLIPSTTPGLYQYSGELSSVGNFYDNTGRANFKNGQYIQIQNADTGLSTAAWTLIMTQEKAYVGNAVLFNSLTGSSGLLVGINDANQLYVKYPANIGYEVKTFDTRMTDKSILGLSYSNQYFSLNKYNYYDNTASAETRVATYPLLPSHNVRIAAGGGSYEAAFTGLMDIFAIATSPMDTATFTGLVAGLVSNGDVDLSVSSLNPNFINTLDTTGLYDVVVGTGNENNSETQYNNLLYRGAPYVKTEPTGFNSNFFKNGVAQIVNEFYQSGANIYPIYDSYSTGNKMVSFPGQVFSTYVFVYDNTEASSPPIFITGDLTNRTGDTTVTNTLLYLNGQKLVSGIDYVNNAGTSQLGTFPTGLTGVLLAVPFNITNNVTGIGTTLELDVSPLNVGIWVNGVRQAGNDYLLCSKYSLLTGQKINDMSLTSIYNN
jgi:hypothetical protein